MKKGFLICVLVVLAVIFASFGYSRACFWAENGNKSEVKGEQVTAEQPRQSQDFGLSYKLPIIMYHSTFEKHPGRYNIPPSLLEKDLLYIKKCGFETIMVSDLIAFKENGKALPKKPIMLTFDDGYLNNYLYAYPLFLKHKMKAVFSVVGSLTDLNYDKDNQQIMPLHSHLNYEQIREMSESGFIEIQNHTDNLHSLKKNCAIFKSGGETAEQYQKRFESDILSMHEKLKERSGVVCTAVAYPFGSYSKKLSAGVLEKIGYKASFTCAEKINIITRLDPLFNLCRFNRPYGKPSPAYFNKIFKECLN